VGFNSYRDNRRILRRLALLLAVAFWKDVRQRNGLVGGRHGRRTEVRHGEIFRSRSYRRVHNVGRRRLARPLSFHHGLLASIHSRIVRLGGVCRRDKNERCPLRRPLVEIFRHHRRSGLALDSRNIYYRFAIQSIITLFGEGLF